MASEVYRATYSWADEGELRRAFALTSRPTPTVVDVAAGPNAAPGTVLAHHAPGSLYVPLDSEPRHLLLLREALGERAQPVLGRRSCLPFRGASLDVVLYHHGIDDVYETEGRDGLQRSLGEAWRVLRRGGSGHSQPLRVRPRCGDGSGIVGRRRKGTRTPGWRGRPPDRRRTYGLAGGPQTHP